MQSKQTSNYLIQRVKKLHFTIFLLIIFNFSVFSQSVDPSFSPVPSNVSAFTGGHWYILRSGEQNYTILQFGTEEDKPVAADFDGDGKADVAVWRPSTGTWYLLQTTAGFGAVQWGTAGDVPTENAFVP
jgi:hypothetical protein